VAIVIDASISTAAASGYDLNANGELGKQPRNKIFPTSTDPGDSLLAAQVAAAKQLVTHFASKDSEFSVVAYSGVNPSDPSRRATDYIVESRLSSDPAALHAALDRVLQYGSKGGKVFSAGMFAAVETLTAASDSHEGSRKLAILMSDSAYPIVLLPGGNSRRADPRMQAAAQQAIDSGVIFQTFGLANAASTKQPHTLGRIAGATGGVFQPVPDVGELGCLLARSLSP
jgi:hypothetical protein